MIPSPKSIGLSVVVIDGKVGQTVGNGGQTVVAEMVLVRVSVTGGNEMVGNGVERMSVDVLCSEVVDGIVVRSGGVNEIVESSSVEDVSAFSVVVRTGGGIVPGDSGGRLEVVVEM
jgi:hypothetical protein